MKIGIIGSFKKHFKQIVLLKTELQNMGHIVINPLGDYITIGNIDFVRSNVDDHNEDDTHIQTRVFTRLFQADVIYVFLVDNYIGRTTCYEVGRLIQGKVPLIFSEKPNDLPLIIPDDRILNPIHFIEAIEMKLPFEPLFITPKNDHELLERGLIFK